MQLRVRNGKGAKGRVLPLSERLLQELENYWRAQRQGKADHDSPWLFLGKKAGQPFSLPILPPGLVRIRHYGILGNNRRRRDIEAVRAIFKRRGCAVELQPQSIVDAPCGRTCCPLCGKAAIRLLAFTDAAGGLHMIGSGPMPCDSS